jgi:Helitron helicase-like domain at N-terminus
MNFINTTLCQAYPADLESLTSELVEETRNRTRENYAAKERHEFDHLEGTTMLASESEHLRTTRGLAEFPSELVEKTRNMIREELRTQREEIDRAVEAQDTTQRLLSRQSLRERTSRPRDTKSRPRGRSWIRRKLLEEEYEETMIAGNDFPPTITPSVLRTATKEYYEILHTGSRRDLCASCGALFEEANLCEVGIDEPYIDENLSRFDNCGIREGLVKLCNGCEISLRKHKIPKFSAANYVNTTFCQAYPADLEGLTYIEECVIALAHPIGAVIKLTSGGKCLGIEYRGSRGHFITFKQDPSQLLTILPSSTLDLYKHVTISWAGMSKPTPENLLAFCRIEKARVLRALLWLVQNNPLYRDVRIDFDLIRSWEDRFVPETLIETAIITDKNAELDHREGYITNLEDGSYENDFDALHEDVEPGTVIGGSFLSDEDGQNKNKQMAFIAKLTELAQEQDVEPHIEYSSTHPESDMIPRSIFHDADYFPAAFPTLFPSGSGGHKDPRRTEDVSLETWGKWTLKHHSRRFAKHPTFIFLLYDIIFLRQSSLGNYLQVKKGYWDSVQHDFSTLTSSQLQQSAADIRSGKVCTDQKIQQLMTDVRLISSYTPESFGRKLVIRHLLWGHIVRFGMPAIWFSLNPADLRSPLIMNLASTTQIPTTPATLETIRRTAVANPVVVAEFFTLTINAFFTALIRLGSTTGGILGPVSDYAAVVETNGRGMLHSHGFIWLAGNIRFPELRERLLRDTEFKTQVIQYLQSIIVESVDEAAAHAFSSQFADETPPTNLATQNDEEWIDLLKMHGNAVAYKRNMHAHTTSCYKYRCKQVVVKKKKRDSEGSITLDRG